MFDTALGEQLLQEKSQQRHIEAEGLELGVQ